MQSRNTLGIPNWESSGTKISSCTYVKIENGIHIDDDGLHTSLGSAGLLLEQRIQACWT